MNSLPQTGTENPPGQLCLKVFGVGTAGINIVAELATRVLPDASCIAVGTRADCEAVSSAVAKICLDAPSLRSPAAGVGSETACRASGEQVANLKAACGGAQVVFIAAGMGGSTSADVAPVLARVAVESGALVLAFVTLPFECEGKRRHQLAQQALAGLNTEANAVICLPNQKLSRLASETTSVVDTFKMMNALLADGMGGIWRLLKRKGLIEIHPSDLCTLLRDHPGESCLATAEAAGPARAREVVEKLLAHPMLDGGEALTDSNALLVSLIGGPDLTMAEVNRVMESIGGKCLRGQVMMGAAIDEHLHGRLAITLIATRHDESSAPETEVGAVPHSGAARTAESIETQLLNRTTAPRPRSRFLPPPPSLTPEKMEQIMAKQMAGSARSRRSASKMRQGQLPLEIVSKGRFDKSEPTIHKGEDLDLPTYIRRGMALN
jgi:cell division protein FtsZ